MISVIIPVYNCEKYIKNCIESILNQTYWNVEIILVDDGSTDSSKMICKEYTKYKNVKLFSKDNGGVSSARNYGLNKANGKYIVFVDSDDYIDLNALEYLINEHSDNVLTCLNYSKTILKKNILTKYSEYNVDNFIEGIFKGTTHGGICGMLFEKNKIDGICFDENTFFMEDTIFLVKYLKKINKIKYIKGQYYHYVENPNSITKSSGKTLKKIKNIYYSLKKMDELLEPKYHKSIENKKVLLVEKELRNCNEKKEFYLIHQFTNSLEYTGNDWRIRFFEKIYNLNSYLFIRCYYIIRKIIKKLAYILK